MYFFKKKFFFFSENTLFFKKMYFFKKQNMILVTLSSLHSVIDLVNNSPECLNETSIRSNYCLATVLVMCIQGINNVENIYTKNVLSEKPAKLLFNKNAK